MASRGRVGIATYEEVIDTLKDADRLLIDVRENDEVAASGRIPTSINIPRKCEFFHFSHDRFR
jgi:3-mercaptopyruvate sulfurtransferase SseA